MHACTHAHTPWLVPVTYVPGLVQVRLWGRCGGLDATNTSRAFAELCCPLESVCNKYNDDFWQVGAAGGRVAIAS